MLRHYLLTTFLLLQTLFVSLLAEPSAFERQSGSTKDDIKKIQSLISKLQQRVDALQQLQEGVSSLYESQSSKLQEQSANSIALTKDIEAIKTQLESNTQDIQVIKAQLNELTQSILKELNNITVVASATKDIPNDNVNTTNKSESKPNSDNKEATKPTEKITFTKDTTKSNEVFKQAQSMFESKQYNEAKPRLEWLVEINHRKATSHFYLGEIAFDEKSYDTAIYHYKQSALTNERAKYMPKLLLHSAQCFNEIKDTKNYNKFLDSLIAHYPSSEEAKTAKKLKSKTKDKK